MIVTEKYRNKIETAKHRLVLDVGVPYQIHTCLFWRLFLGHIAFTLYETLISFVSAQKLNVVAVIFSKDILLAMQGWGTHRTLLGRVLSGHRRSQRCAVAELAANQIVRHCTRGTGRQLSHAFEVLSWLPILTPTQVKKLLRQHTKFLGYLPDLKLAQWRNVTFAFYMPVIADSVGCTAVVIDAPIGMACGFWDVEKDLFNNYVFSMRTKGAKTYSPYLNF